MALPYFPWHPQTFRSDLRIHSLSCAEEGLYHRILDFMWLYPGYRLPADYSSLFRILSLKKGPDWHWRAWISKLITLQLLVVENNYLYAPKLSSLHALAVEKSK